MNIIAALLMFGFIIFIHELGHFYFAKRAGVTIHEFSIGMGPKLFGFEKEGIVYNIRLFPIGGYVAMEGEDEESDDPNSFGKKTLWQRFLSIFAGPMANIILCVILLIPYYFVVGTPNTTFGHVIEKSPSAKAGMQVGDKITEIDGEKISSFEQLSSRVVNSGGRDLKVTFERNGQNKSVVIKPQKVQGKYIIGIQHSFDKASFRAIPEALYSTYNIAKTMLTLLWNLITGQLPGSVVNSLAGPVGVIKMASNAANNGFMNLVFFTAIISFNIGIVNLLPIPALDGWRILILLLEFIRGGKKLPAKIEGYINGAGLVALLGFMVFITYKDILRLIVHK